MPMKKLVRKTLIAVVIMVVIGCSSSDERLARQAIESAQRQAEQNREMSQLNREVAEGTKRIAEAVSQTREEMIAMETDLQDQRNRLEEERRSLADERYRESLLTPIIGNLGLMLVCSLPLVLAWYLLHGLRSQTSDSDDVSNLLIRELTSVSPTLLPLAASNRRAIEHAAQQYDEDGEDQHGSDMQ